MAQGQLLDSSTADLAEFINRHDRAGECLIQIAGEAEVTCQGRAASSAEAGNDLPPLKRDGSLQIRHPRSIRPMNWQLQYVDTDRRHLPLTEVVRGRPLSPSCSERPAGNSGPAPATRRR